MKLAYHPDFLKFPYFAACKSSCRSVFKQGGKSGQQRAPYFLTGRALTGDGQRTASATENKPPLEMAKTCLVYIPEERVKRWGKSPPPPQ